MNKSPMKALFSVLFAIALSSAVITTTDISGFSLPLENPADTVSPAPKCEEVPASFALLSPANGVSGQPWTLLLDWEDSSGASDYTLYLGTSSPAPQFQAGITASEFSAGALADGTTYYWRVEAVNIDGKTISDEWSFTTSCMEEESWFPGAFYAPARSVLLNGDHLYYANGAYLQTLYVGGPGNPVKVDETILPGAMGEAVMAMSGSHLFVPSANTGLFVFSLADPAHPSQEGFLPLTGGADGVARLAGTTLYLCWGSVMHIIDISTPSSPSLLGTYTSPGGPVRSVAVKGNYAFVTDYLYGIRLVDISTPSAPVEVPDVFPPIMNGAEFVESYGDVLYLADFAYGVRLFDITDPLVPVEQPVCVAEESESLNIKGTILYVANGNYGLSLFSLASPLAPMELGRFDSSGYTYHADASGTTAFLADSFAGIRKLDISNPGAIVETGYFDESYAQTYGIRVAGDNAFVACLEEGMRVFDISDSAAPTPIPGANPVIDGRDIFIVGTTAYVADAFYGVRILDITDPAAITQIGGFNDPFAVRGLSVAGTNVFFVIWNNMKVLDAEDPSSPVLKGTFTAPVAIRDLAARDDLVFIAAGATGIRIIDVSDPNAPIEAGYFDPPGFVRGVDVSGNIAASVEDKVLRLIDVTTPSAPVELGSLNLPANPFGVTISGSLAFVSDGISGVRMIDISNPSSPIEIGSYDTPNLGYTFDNAPNWTSAVLADGYGIRIIDLSGCFSTPPGALSLAFPPAGSSNLECSTRLGWQGGPLSLSYDLYLDTVDPPAVLFSSGLALPEIDVTLSPSTTYYWKVVARNPSGTTSSEVRSFSTGLCMGPLEVPEGSVRVGLEGDDLVISWNETCGTASDYIVYQGTIASLTEGSYDHTSIICGDSGADLQEVFAPASQDVYYLVVPINSSGIIGGFGHGRPAGSNSAGCHINGQLEGEGP